MTLDTIAEDVYSLLEVRLQQLLWKMAPFPLVIVFFFLLFSRISIGMLQSECSSFSIPAVAAWMLFAPPSRSASYASWPSWCLFTWGNILHNNCYCTVLLRKATRQKKKANAKPGFLVL